MNLRYALGQIAGVWRMAFDRPGWEQSFDRSLNGVFGSFWAVVWTAPLLIANFAALKTIFANAKNLPDDPLLGAPMPFWIGSNLATFAVDWAIGLAALLAAAHFLGASKRAGDAVIGYNWLQPITAAAQAAPVGAGFLFNSTAAFSLLMMPAIAIAIAVYWGVLRRGLGLAPGLAIAVTAGTLLLSVIVGALCHGVALGIYGAPQ